MVQFNVKTTCIYKQLFKSANSISLSNDNPSCFLNFKTTNNKNKNNNFFVKLIIQLGLPFDRDRSGDFYRKRLKSCKVFIYIICDTQSKRFFLNQEFTGPTVIMRFGAKFFVSPKGSKHLGETKTCTNDEN